MSLRIDDPNAAGPRADLTFLRRRSRPRPVAVPARPTIDFSRPGRTPAAKAAPLDLSATQLDLSRATDDAGAGTSHRPARQLLPRYRGPRVATGDHLVLGPAVAAATLTRVQSGVGRLTVCALCSADVGDVRLGALFALRSGASSSVQLAGGNRFAPSSRRPLIVASREEFEQLAIDLRQVGDIERITVYAVSESRTPLTWGGTLLVTTFGGARLEVPLESLAPGAVAVLASIYNLDGELVVRAELETIAGDVREAARAYGYDRITWRDDRTPVD